MPGGTNHSPHPDIELMNRYLRLAAEWLLFLAVLAVIWVLVPLQA